MLTPSKVRGWHAGLAQAHPSTAAKAYRLLASILRTAVTDGLLLASPCKVKGAGAERAPERPIATVAEIEALVGALPERFRVVVLLATWCQLRRGELLGLRRRDVDLLRGTLGIEQSRAFTRDGHSLVKEPKSAAGRRTVAIPPQSSPHSPSTSSASPRPNRTPSSSRARPASRSRGGRLRCLGDDRERESSRCPRHRFQGSAG